MIWPEPWQSGQGCWTWKKPRVAMTWPAPPQVEQVLAPPGLAEPEPLHFSQLTERSRSMDFSVPLAASSREISRS